MMCCVSNGAPAKPGKQTDEQKGMQSLWDFLHNHNAIFVGDPGLDKELEDFLKRNHIRRGAVTDEQKDYNEKVKKVVEALP